MAERFDLERLGEPPDNRAGFSSYERFNEAWKEAEPLMRGLRAEEACINLFGSLAVWRVAGDLQPWLTQVRRGPSDIDAVGYGIARAKLRKFMTQQGYEVNQKMAVSTEGYNYIFNPINNLHSFTVEVRFDALEFCHTIPLRGRLSVDGEVLPIADLLLSKLEIIEVNRHDIIDLLVLLNITNENLDNFRERIKQRVVFLLQRDWGAWYTVKTNLSRTGGWLETFGYDLDTRIIKQIKQTVEWLNELINRCPKSPGWRFRALLGTRFQWYRTVSEQNEIF